MLIRVALIMLLMFAAGLSLIRAQGVHQVIPASAGIASGTGGIVSFTAGQLVYKTHVGSNGSVSQGIQQPYEIWDVLGNEETTGLLLTVTAFPNPVSDYLTLKCAGAESQHLSYALFNVDGTVICSGKIKGTETRIPMSDIPASVYFLKVTDNVKEVRIFKIVKN